MWFIYGVIFKLSNQWQLYNTNISKEETTNWNWIIDFFSAILEQFTFLHLFWNLHVQYTIQQFGHSDLYLHLCLLCVGKSHEQTRPGFVRKMLLNVLKQTPPTNRPHKTKYYCVGLSLIIQYIHIYMGSRVDNTEWMGTITCGLRLLDQYQRYWGSVEATQWNAEMKYWFDESWMVMWEWINKWGFRPHLCT